jgi:GGDEF domain-containing protein
MSRVISFKKYLFGGEADTREDVLLRAVSLLLDGLSLHAMEGDRTDYEAFQTEIGGLKEKFTPEVEPGDMLVVIGSVLKSLEAYNRTTSSYLRFQANELHSMVSMLTETVSMIAAGQDRSVKRLQDIEKQIEKASVSEDLRVLKVRLSDCLTSLRDASEDQQAESTRIVEGLTEGIKRAQVDKKPGVIATDSVTGLPTRVEAERVLAEAIHEGKRVFAAVFVVERLQSINARFGYSVGDKVLTNFAQWLANGSAGDRVFRWSGPAFMILLERDGPLEFVRSEVVKICSRTLEMSIELSSRSILLPISSAWSLFPMLASARLVANKLDSFIATQLGEGK